MTTKSAIIAEAAVTGEELEALITELEPIMLGASSDVAIIACFCMAASLMNPYASAEELQEVVYQTSQYMCLALDGKGEMSIIGSPAKGSMN